MKTLVIIISVYMAGLSVYPCYEDDCVEKPGITSATEDHGKDHQDEEDQDMCTPFCVSACCSIHVYCSVYPGRQMYFKPAMKENSLYTIPFVPAVVISIWQPPKLA